MRKEIKITIVACIIAFLIGFSFLGGLGGGGGSASASSSAFDMDAIKNGNYNVYTESEDTLPVLSKDQLETAFKKGYTTNKKLLKYVDEFYNMQKNYKVNAVFCAAVAIKETTAGTKGHAVDECHNWFNYKTADGMKTGPHEWVQFSDEKDCIDGFGRYISKHGSHYFTHKEYTVDEISKHYCPPGDGWAKEVKEFINQLYEAVGIDTSSSSSSDGSSTSSKGDGYDEVITFNGRTYKLFKQSKGTYSDTVTYSGDHIHHSGCGPTSAAIIASGYGKDYNPGTLVTAAKKKYNVSNFTANIYSTQKMLTTAGLKTKIYTSVSKSKLIKQLKSGKPVAVSTKDADGKHIFTKKSHYIALLAINDKNEVYVANPNPDTKKGWTDIDVVLRNINMGAIFVLD